MRAILLSLAGALFLPSTVFASDAVQGTETTFTSPNGIVERCVRIAIGSGTMASGQHQPLNRQAERYTREGVALSLSTLADQAGVGACGAALAPIHALIETVFRTVQTGCRIEALRLATADRLANCIAPCRVAARRVSWLTMLGREAPKAALSNVEHQLLERRTPDSKQKLPRDLDFHVGRLARRKGHPDRTFDAPSDTTVIWRGLSRRAAPVQAARIAQTPSA